MDFRNNSLTITSRAETAFCGLEDTFATMYSRQDFERVMDTVRAAKGSARASRFLPALYAMFDACGIDYEQRREDAYYDRLIEEKISADAYDGEAFEDRMVLALYDRFNGYSTPSDYIERLLDRLEKKEDREKWADYSLRIRLLKQFVKYGNYLEDAGYGSRPTIEKYVSEKTGKSRKELVVSEIADAIDEDIFMEFDNPADEKKAKEDRKPQNKHGLLKICDDLAYGKFRTQGGTKKALYLLAMALDMKLAGFPGANDENDVVKNLFRDYYTNNLMRYMTDAYKGHSCEFEDPSGQGVNFKNFAEMVYLYYIAKGDMEPQEKIRMSSAMIDELTKEAKENRPDGKKVQRNAKDVLQTKFYRRRFVYKDQASGMELFSEDILGRGEEQFKVFLLENYDCDTGMGNTYTTRTGEERESTVGVLQMDTDQNTAFRIYKEILQKLGKELEIRGMTLEDCRYGLWFIDMAANEKEGFASIPDRHSGIDRKRFDDFMEVLRGANSFISSLSVIDAKDITRTSLMAAYYYYFNVVHEEESHLSWSGYGDLFEEFKNGLDPLLEECGYQPVSGKCIFDVLLTFSAYARIIL